MFFQVGGVLLANGLVSLDEAVFHLIAYKHMRTHYYRIAEICESARLNIVLVNPSFPRSLWDFSGCRDLSGDAFPFPPLSLPTLAALTPPGHRVAIVDENVAPRPRDLAADVVGITGYQVQKERVFALADDFRKRGKLVAIGGPLVRAAKPRRGRRPRRRGLPRRGGGAPGRGSSGCGSRERTPALRAGHPRGPRRIAGAALRAPGAAGLRGRAHRDLARLSPFLRVLRDPVRLGRRPRLKPAAQVLQEIRSLAHLGAGSIFHHRRQLLRRPRARRRGLDRDRPLRPGAGRGLAFSCQATIDVALDERLLELMAQANVRRASSASRRPGRPAWPRRARPRTRASTWRRRCAASSRAASWSGAPSSWASTTTTRPSSRSSPASSRTPPSP